MNNIYFLNAPINYKLTGIEHASLNRYRLFKDLGLNPKIITLNFSTEIFTICSMHRVENSDFINLYKSYQNFTEDKEFTLDVFLKSLVEPDVQPVLNVSSDCKVYIDGLFVMYICCFKGTNRISYINYFNSEREKIRRELYDYLGYKSAEFVLNDNAVVQQNYFDCNGGIYLTVSHHADKQFFCLHYLNKKLFFRDLLSLHQHWLESLIDGDTYFFIDKNRVYNQILKKIKNEKLKKIAIIHSTHTSNPNIQDNKKINSNYKFLLDNQQYFDACIVATQAQYLDLVNDFEMEIPVYVIPPSYIKEYRVNMYKQKDCFKIISIGRVAVEKRQEDMIMAMTKVIKEIPNARLDLFGLGAVEQLKRIEDLIIEKNLDQHVFLKGYFHDIKEELFEAHLSLVTSKVESFCISILDSLEQGTPVISYDIKYGPASIIEDGVNGALVEQGNHDKLSKLIVEYYYNHMEAYTLNTKNVVNNYSSEKIARKWIDLLDDLCYFKIT